MYLNTRKHHLSDMLNSTIFYSNMCIHLTALDIYQLLEIWASILLFIQIMSMVSSYQYKSFVSDLYRIIPMDTYERAMEKTVMTIKELVDRKRKIITCNYLLRSVLYRVIQFVER
ncbi:hypothetical protein [Pseudobutyrivibrio xylanivorans]|uniref:Uncharacterized protein n=1 Tax=Pseudobutyrivibrio xylanivorans TaxID=185007 RepID=A0A1G5S1G9_PSEXY|nr:hypothetical protein [Pseudobutyrivibrio xylanivorans]SCZ79571.1 hypothetical protein SAMN02910350_01860 [Pseudobutyrivibrio xylanivorans]